MMEQESRVAKSEKGIRWAQDRLDKTLWEWVTASVWSAEGEEVRRIALAEYTRISESPARGLKMSKIKSHLKALSTFKLGVQDDFFGRCAEKSVHATAVAEVMQTWVSGERFSNTVFKAQQKDLSGTVLVKVVFPAKADSKRLRPNFAVTSSGNDPLVGLSEEELELFLSDLGAGLRMITFNPRTFHAPGETCSYEFSYKLEEIEVMPELETLMAMEENGHSEEGEFQETPAEMVERVSQDAYVQWSRPGGRYAAAMKLEAAVAYLKEKLSNGGMTINLRTQLHEASRALAGIYYRVGFYQKSVDHLREALAASPDAEWKATNEKDILEMRFAALSATDLFEQLGAKRALKLSCEELLGRMGKERITGLHRKAIENIMEKTQQWIAQAPRVQEQCGNPTADVDRYLRNLRGNSSIRRVYYDIVKDEEFEGIEGMFKVRFHLPPSTEQKVRLTVEVVEDEKSPITGISKEKIEALKDRLGRSLIVYTEQDRYAAEVQERGRQLQISLSGKISAKDEEFHERIYGKDAHDCYVHIDVPFGLDGTGVGD
jgi:tetratricopeptide (TPR) repeat protein